MVRPLSLYQMDMDMGFLPLDAPNTISETSGSANDLPGNLAHWKIREPTDPFANKVDQTPAKFNV